MKRNAITRIIICSFQLVGMLAGCCAATDEGTKPQTFLPFYFQDKTVGIVSGDGVVYSNRYRKVYRSNWRLVLVRSAQGYCWVEPDSGRMEFGPFDYAEPFGDGLAAVLVGKRYGFIDKKGEMVIRPAFSRVGKFHEGAAPVVRAGERLYGMVDKNGNYIIEPKYTRLNNMNSGFCVAVYRMKKYYLDRQGNRCFGRDFRDCRDMLDGVGAVMAFDSVPAWCTIDSDGNLGKKRFHRLGAFSEGVTWFRGANGLHGFVDRNSQVVIPAAYNRLTEFREGVAAVKMKEKWFFINKSHERVFDHWFDLAWSFADGFAEVFYRGRFNYLKRDGTFLMPVGSGVTLK